MKILQVIPYFAPRWGGDVNVCYSLSKELSKLGHDVTIITTDFEYDQGYARSLENVKVIPFRRVANLGMFLYSPDMKGWLRSNISKYDIVHLHSFRSYQNNIVSKYAKKFNVPYIVQPHGSLPRIVEKESLKQLYDVVWGNEILKSASKIIAVSGNEVEQFRQVGIPDGQITVIPNGVNYVSPASLPPAGQFREQYGIHEKHIILYVGRIHKRKGIDFLIRAFNSFIQTWIGDDVTLVIIGPDDGYRSVLEGLVEQLGLSDKVRFIGFIPSLAAAYQDADVLVYPSTYEIFGLVPFEALLCGTPVIVTDDCGCGELIKEAECGYLVHYGDVAGLAETLRSALEHLDVNRGMVEAGRRYVEKRLVWESVVKQVEGMYEGCY
ncbi:N-acetyl-alpha-D-glucosaminyl L-malate synthase [anaerobic digester metagenome]